MKRCSNATAEAGIAAPAEEARCEFLAGLRKEPPRCSTPLKGAPLAHYPRQGLFRRTIHRRVDQVWCRPPQDAICKHTVHGARHLFVFAKMRCTLRVAAREIVAPCLPTLALNHSNHWIWPDSRYSVGGKVIVCCMFEVQHTYDINSGVHGGGGSPIHNKRHQSKFKLYVVNGALAFPGDGLSSADPCSK